MTHATTAAQPASAEAEGSRLTSSVLTAVVFVGLALFYFANALMLPSAEAEGMGPKTFPIAVGTVLLIASVIGAFTVLTGKVEAKPVSGKELLRAGLCAALFALYAWSIFLIGFAEATAVFSVLVTRFAFSVRMSWRRLLVTFVGSLAIGMLLFLIFDVWLNVLLPVGWLEFWAFGGMNL